MNFKLDENLGPTILQLFLHKGHDCRTILEEHLGGAPDETVLAAAGKEARVLVTMDHDFGKEKTIHGKLWIVEPTRIREHETAEE